MESASQISRGKIFRKTRKSSNLLKNRSYLINKTQKHQIFNEATVSAPKPSTSKPQSTSTTTEIINKMQKHEEMLRCAIQKARERNEQERQTYQKLLKYYEDQQSILDARREMMKNNCDGYKSLVTSMQHVIITLRGRLNRFHEDIEEDDEDEEDEIDEGFCDNEE